GIRLAALLSLMVGTTAPAQSQTKVVIATVNNGDMIIMQKLSKEFEKAHPEIKLDWVVLEENVLRERATTDIATKGGSFDVMTIPEKPTYADVEKFAKATTDRSKGISGICLRGKPGWGENMAYLDTLVNTFGGRWFDEKWKPQLTSPEWKEAVTFYVNMMKK